MKTHQITNNLIDVFLTPEKYHTTGYDPSLWLRLQKRKGQWIQLSGIHIPSWKFKQITENL